MNITHVFQQMVSWQLTLVLQNSCYRCKIRQPAHVLFYCYLLSRFTSIFTLPSYYTRATSIYSIDACIDSIPTGLEEVIESNNIIVEFIQHLSQRDVL